jgi:tetratricopeptide (TPR) repeat protein
MKTIDFSYFIERYNACEMDDSERQWFQKELEGNKKLLEEVELRSKTDKVLNDYSAVLLRNKLGLIEKQRAEAIKVNPPKRNSPLRYAAIIALLILMGSLYLFTSNRNLAGNDILDRFYTPYEGISASRSQETVNLGDFKTALDYYNIHDYNTAAVYFQKVLTSNPGDMESTMLFGVSNFEEKNYPVATQSFTKVVDNNDNLFIEDAQWYLALCYIQTNDQTRAAEQLATIKNSESIYRKDARKVLKRIR